MRIVLAVAAAASMFGGSSAYSRDSVRADVTAVRSLYKAFAWEAILAEPGPEEQTLAVLPRSVLLKYLTPELAELILQDRQCIARTQGICNLDFMPLWDSQDATGATVTITGESKPGNVFVRIHYLSDQEMKMHFRLAHEPAGWKIADIVYEGGGATNGTISLTRLLATPVVGDNQVK